MYTNYLHNDASSTIIQSYATLIHVHIYTIYLYTLLHRHSIQLFYIPIRVYLRGSVDLSQTLQQQ